MLKSEKKEGPALTDFEMVGSQLRERFSRKKPSAPKKVVQKKHFKTPYSTRKSCFLRSVYSYVSDLVVNGQLSALRDFVSARQEGRIEADLNPFAWSFQIIDPDHLIVSRATKRKASVEMLYAFRNRVHPDLLDFFVFGAGGYEQIRKKLKEPDHVEKWHRLLDRRAHEERDSWWTEEDDRLTVYMKCGTTMASLLAEPFPEQDPAVPAYEPMNLAARQYAKAVRRRSRKK